MLAFLPGYGDTILKMLNYLIVIIIFYRVGFGDHDHVGAGKLVLEQLGQRRFVVEPVIGGALAIHRSTVEAVVLPPVDTSGWTRESLDEEIAAIHASYREVLEGGV